MGQQEPVFEQKRFGRYLRKIREQRRLSLDAVEAMSLDLPGRVTKSHLSRIENGQAVPTFPRMFTLSRIYGVPVSHIAERFELCLKLGMFPPVAASKSVTEVLDEAKRLRIGGRHTEALLFYESLLERTNEVPEDKQASWIVDLRLECVNCLVKLSREATGKEECEKLLSWPGLSPLQQVLTLQYLAMCSYRLGKFTVAMMAIDRAEKELGSLEPKNDLGAFLAVLKGNLQFVTKHYGKAAEAFRVAVGAFEERANSFEACRTRLNLAAALIELGAFTEARELLDQAMITAETEGYDRQRAYAISHIGYLAHRDGKQEEAESYFLRSNLLARTRDYASILFRNCFYLWQIARTRKDDAAIKVNERTLRTYLSRVEGYMPEAEEFSTFLGGGK